MSVVDLPCEQLEYIVEVESVRVLMDQHVSKRKKIDRLDEFFQVKKILEVGTERGLVLLHKQHDWFAVSIFK